MWDILKYYSDDLVSNRMFQSYIVLQFIQILVPKSVMQIKKSSQYFFLICPFQQDVGLI